jgi:hypothetical protein
VALTRCGHVTTGWTSILDDEPVAEQLRIRCVEDGAWNDTHHLWGRLCDGPAGEPARGAALRQLREAWRVLVGLWLPTPDAEAPLSPGARFEPVKAGAWRASPQLRDEAFLSLHGALAVASGGGTFCAENVPERGYRAHLEPLRLTWERGVVRGAVPVRLEGREPPLQLLCVAARLRGVELRAYGQAGVSTMSFPSGFPLGPPPESATPDENGPATA